MDKVVQEFERRHRAVTAKHRKLAEGYVTALNRNGTIEHKPLRRVTLMKLKTAVMTLGVFIAFKAYLLANLGLDGYETHIARLSDGSTIEKVGSWIMAMDPASVWFAEKIQYFLT